MGRQQVLFEDTEIVKEIFDIITEIAEEIRFEFAAEKLTIEATNEVMSVITKFVLSEKHIEKNFDEKSFFLYSEDIEDALAKVDSNEDIKLVFKPGKVVMSVKGSCEREYEFEMVDGGQNIPEDNCKPEVTASMNTSDFFEYLDKINFIGDAAEFHAKKNRIVLISESDRSSANMELSKEYFSDLKINSSVRGCYKLGYLEYFEGIKNIFEEIDLKFSGQSPLILYQNKDDILFRGLIAFRKS